jgi:hypothetical protein
VGKKQRAPGARRSPRWAPGAPQVGKEHLAYHTTGGGGLLVSLASGQRGRWCWCFRGCLKTTHNKTGQKTALRCCKKKKKPTPGPSFFLGPKLQVTPSSSSSERSKLQEGWRLLEAAGASASTAPAPAPRRGLACGSCVLLCPAAGPAAAAAAAAVRVRGALRTIYIIELKREREQIYRISTFSFTHTCAALKKGARASFAATIFCFNCQTYPGGQFICLPPRMWMCRW